MKSASVLLLLLLLVGGAHAAQMYKWIDQDGKVQYTDTPPPTNAKNVEKRKVQGNVIQANEPPFSMQQTTKNFPVTLWVTDCGEVCDKARTLLNSRGVPFTEKNPQTPETIEEFKKLTKGDLQVPLIQIGDLKTIKGYESDEWNAALDTAGYPKGKSPAAAPAAK
ncbi:MAG TPA: glutaredoxin family protein [Burkholderiales bacterium]|nr:glutaredoxin family protein [Burkholderiales bacterium]